VGEVGIGAGVGARPQPSASAKRPVTSNTNPGNAGVLEAISVAQHAHIVGIMCDNDASVRVDNRHEERSGTEIHIDLVRDVPIAIVFEVRSIDDRARHIAHKIDVYLRAGTALVAIVDPYQRAITLQDVGAIRVLHDGDRFEHRALPGFSFGVNTLFAKLEWRGS
jgi:Putative restriction endonuclease